MAYILGGFSRGDTESVLASSPHLFLLSCQILTENVIHGFRGVSLPVRALTPILYNAVRLTSLYRWVTRVLTRDAPPISSEVLGRPLIIWSLLVNRDVNLWSSFGKALAVVNWLFWHFNLFGFLVCVFLPRAMAAYYQGKLPPQVLRPAKPPVKEADAEPNREHHSKKGQ